MLTNNPSILYQYCKRTVLFTFVTDERRSISQDIKSDIEQKPKINYIISVKAFFHTKIKKTKIIREYFIMQSNLKLLILSMISTFALSGCIIIEDDYWVEPSPPPPPVVHHHHHAPPPPPHHHHAPPPPRHHHAPPPPPRHHHAPPPPRHHGPHHVGPGPYRGPHAGPGPRPGQHGGPHGGHQSSPNRIQPGNSNGGHHGGHQRR